MIAGRSASAVPEERQTVPFAGQWGNISEGVTRSLGEGAPVPKCGMVMCVKRRCGGWFRDFLLPDGGL